MHCLTKFKKTPGIVPGVKTRSFRKGSMPPKIPLQSFVRLSQLEHIQTGGIVLIELTVVCLDVRPIKTRIDHLVEHDPEPSTSSVDCYGVFTPCIDIPV